MGGTWDATNLVAGDVAVIGPRSGWTTSPSSARRSPTSRGRRPGSSRRGRSRSSASRHAEAAAVLRHGAPTRSARRSCTRVATGRSTERSWRSAASRSAARTPRDLRGPLPADVRRVRRVATRRPAIGRVRGAHRPGARRATRCARGSPGVRIARPPGGRRRARPSSMLDGAHNPAGAEALADALREFFTVGPAPPRDRGEREQGPRRGLAPLAPLADVVLRDAATTACGAPTPSAVADGRSAAAGSEVPRSTDRGAAALEAARRRGRARGRSSGDGLSVHCRGRAPGARLAHAERRTAALRTPTDDPRTNHGHRIDAADRQARRRAPRSRRRGAAPRRGEGAHDRRAGLFDDRPRRPPRSTTASTARSRSSASSSTSSRAGRWWWPRSPASDAITCWRTLMGPTNPVEAPPGSIRGDFATVIGENIVHGCDSADVGGARAEALLRRLRRSDRACPVSPTRSSGRRRRSSTTCR